MSQTNPKITYEQAKKQVIKTRNFYINFAIYVLVNARLFGIDWIPDKSWDWSFWVIAGWGLGLMFEAASVYFPNLNFYKKWEEEKIQEMLSKNDKN
jgi:hypothetical protein